MCAAETFSEDTPLASIEALLPDVLVKGADWARTEVVGADLVEGWGGKVVQNEDTSRQTDGFARDTANQDLARLRQPNLLPYSASSRC